MPSTAARDEWKNRDNGELLDLIIDAERDPAAIARTILGLREQATARRQNSLLVVISVLVALSSLVQATVAYSQFRASHAKAAPAATIAGGQAGAPPELTEVCPGRGGRPE